MLIVVDLKVMIRMMISNLVFRVWGGWDGVVFREVEEDMVGYVCIM